MAPTADEKVPLGQGVGLIVLVLGQKEPALQFKTVGAPETGQYALTGHGSHSDDDDPLLDWYVPGEQGVGLMVPSLGQILPVGQGLQVPEEVAATADEKVPLGQALPGKVKSVPSQYRPDGQGWGCFVAPGQKYPRCAVVLQAKHCIMVRAWEVLEKKPAGQGIGDPAPGGQK